MDLWSEISLCLLIGALALVGWGLFSPAHRLPIWTHKHDKLWHILAFAGLAALSLGVWESRIWTVWLILTSMGLLTEILQERYTTGRRFSWGDALANTLGTTLGLVVASPIWAHIRYLAPVSAL